MVFELSSIATEMLFDLLVKTQIDKKTIYANKYYCENTLRQLVDFLSQEKYPVESFDLCCPVSKYFASYAKKMTPDLTIVDTETVQPLAFFRTYHSLEEFVKDDLFDEAYHFNKHSQLLLHCPYYIVVSDNSILTFFNLRSLIYLGEKNPNYSIALPKPLGYELLKNNASYRILHNRIISASKLERYGKLACSFLIPLLAAALLILDAYDIYALSTLRLIVCGIALLALLIPYLAHVTIKDVSVEFGPNKKRE